MLSPPDRPVQLSISIVLHNSSLELLRRALASLALAVRHARDGGMLARALVYVVDNASDEGYRQALKKWLASFDPGDGLALEFLPQSGNFGFGYGHNQVLEKLVSDYHLVLNPDAELADDVLSVGLSRLESNREIALLSPKFTGSSGEQEFLCKAYPSVLVLMLRGFAPAFLSRPFQSRLHRYELRDLCSGDQSAEVEIASGCFMLLRTGALRAVGGFDEHYFLYFEDFDLSLRLAGEGKLVFEPAMKVLHHGGYAATKGWRHVKLFVRSGIRFFSLHGWRWI